MLYNFTRTGAQIEEIHNTVDDLPNIVSNDNIISNSSFEIAGNVANPPDATPRNYNAGDELFQGMFAVGALTGVTYIGGKANGIGHLYTDVFKSEKQKLSTANNVASIADSDGSPVESGASLVDSGDYWRVTFDMTNTFSVKLEQGDFATSHNASQAYANSLLEDIKHMSLAEAKAYPRAEVGMRLVITDRGNGEFEYVSGAISNTFSVIDHDTLPVQIELKVETEGLVVAEWLGVVGDEFTPNSDAMEFINNNYSKAIFGSLYYRIERPFGLNKSFNGNGKRETYFIIDNDIDGAMFYPSGQGVTSARLDGITVITKEYRDTAGSDTSGVAMWLHSRPVLNEVEFFGFGGAGVRVPGVSEPTPITYGLLLGRFIHCNFQFSGIGADFIHTATAPDFSTTTRFEDCYFASCQTGLNARNLKSMVLDDVLFEFCLLGANLQTCSGSIPKWYFEGNTTPYEINGGAITIGDELLAASNTNPPIIKRNASNQPTPAFTKISPNSVSSQSIGLFTDDGGTPAADREQKLTLLSTDASKESIPLRLEEYPTKSLGDQGAVIPISHSSEAISKTIVLRIGADGVAQITDPLIQAITKPAVGIYNIAFERSMTVGFISAKTVELYSASNAGSNASVMMVESVSPNNNWTRYKANGSITGFRINVTDSVGTFEDNELMVIIYADLT